MKRYVSSSTITAATRHGTTYYKASLDQILQVLKKENANVWLIGALQDSGFDALDVQNRLFGSRVINNDIYICVTDGYDITVNGQTTDPETALDDFDVEELSNYISDATDEIIHRYITVYELDFSNFDTENIAVSLLTEDHIMFSDLYSDYGDLPM